MLDYKILASGSTGNAVRIGEIMFDCGIPFKHMKEELYKVNTLCLTHTHKDHINPATIKRILKEFPRIEVIGNPTTAYKYPVNTIVTTNEIITKSGIKVIPFECSHDVETTGYIVELLDLNYIYATDTSDLEVPDGERFDYMFIESNYDERKLTELAKQYRKGGYDPVINSQRHLSKQKCKAFFYVHRKSLESKLIELHKSRRFY